MCRILIVDDDARVLTALGRTLRGDGHEVHTAESAESALGELARFAPDLVLSDVRMAGMDGLEFLRLVRERVPGVPVVLMTRMTLMPARRLEARVPAMRDKGRIRVGADADLVIFDPATVRDRSTYQQQSLPPEGIEHVLVGGVEVVSGGRVVEGVAPGRGIRAPR